MCGERHKPVIHASCSSGLAELRYLALSCLCLVFAGCTSENSWVFSGGNVDLTAGAVSNPDDKPAVASEKQQASCAPSAPPRTFCQALQAYCHCLHCPPPEKKDEKTNNGKKDNKEGNGGEKENGEKKNGEEKKSDDKNGDDKNGDDKNGKEPEVRWYSAHA